MKTTEEIKARIAAIADDDWMGTQQSDLIHYLPFDEAKNYLKDGVTVEQWDGRTITPPLDAVKDYLPFAWGKANDCRGLSASRSLDHLKAWLWLAGFDSIVAEHFQDYDYYGKFQLVLASELTGFDWKKEDDGRWVNGEDDDSLSDSEIAALAKEAVEVAEKAKSEVQS
ncbi:MAG: hypothetical protein V4772_08890 [Pseudomonadota bacterium]